MVNVSVDLHGTGPAWHAGSEGEMFLPLEFIGFIDKSIRIVHMGYSV